MRKKYELFNCQRQSQVPGYNSSGGGYATEGRSCVTHWSPLRGVLYGRNIQTFVFSFGPMYNKVNNVNVTVTSHTSTSNAEEKLCLSLLRNPI